jgi:hypothetical protein
LVAVVVNGLLPQQAQARLLLLCHCCQQARNRQRLQLLTCIHLNMDGTVCAHGQSCTQGLLRRQQQQQQWQQWQQWQAAALGIKVQQMCSGRTSKVCAHGQSCTQRLLVQ